MRGSECQTKEVLSDLLVSEGLKVVRSESISFSLVLVSKTHGGLLKRPRDDLRGKCITVYEFTYVDIKAELKEERERKFWASQERLSMNGRKGKPKEEKI